VILVSGLFHPCFVARFFPSISKGEKARKGESAKARKRESTNVEAHGVRLKARM
jgi:hypothetical protein